MIGFCFCRYAIYIPLFLPIMIPVIQSIMNILKQFRERRKTAVGEGKVKDD